MADDKKETALKNIRTKLNVIKNKLSQDKKSKENVIIIAIDALRADHLGCYGYDKNTSPNIDACARNGVLFNRAFSCSNATDVSFTTIMSGTYPGSHGIRSHGPKTTDFEITRFNDSKIQLIQEVLRDNGFNTFGIDWMGRWHKRGFDYYSGDQPHFSSKPISLWTRPNAKELTDEAIECINNSKRPFFLFIHYWDTHTPYYSAPDFYEEFMPQVRGTDLQYFLKDIVNLEWKNYLSGLSKTRGTIEEIIASYDAAIKYVDQEIGRLIDNLKRNSILKDTIIIITSDHGESLTEHGILFDHHGLYDESIHVPLILNNLSQNGKIINRLVQHVDIVPTILDMLNIPYGKKNIDGVSLIPDMTGKKCSDWKIVIAEESYTEKKKAIRTNKWKYIHSLSKEDAVCSYCNKVHGGEVELYNLINDPKENNNIVSDRPDIVEKLALIERYFDDFITKKTPVSERMINNEIRVLEGNP